MKFRHDVTIRFAHCDPAGILFFARIFDLAHEAYEEWVRHCGFSPAEWFAHPEWAVPLRHCQAEYLQPMRLAQTFSVSAQILKIGDRSFQMEWSFEQAGFLFAKVQTGHVFISKSSGKPIPLPVPASALRT